MLLSITELPPNWWPTRLKQESEIVLNDSANVGNVHCNVGMGPGGGGDSFLWAFISWSVCCVFYSIPCMKFLRCVVNWGGFSTIWYDAGKYKIYICLTYSEGTSLAPPSVFAVSYHSTVALRSFMFQQHYLILAVDLTISTLKINYAVYWQQHMSVLSCYFAG